MRNLVLALLLANFLVLAWGLWIAAPEVAEPARVTTPASDVRLVLYRRAGAGVSVSPAPPPLTFFASDTTLRCERIGPFVSADIAESIGKQLGARGISVDLTREPGSIWVGHWVQVIGLSTEVEARRALARLVAAGLVDAYIVETEPNYNISLGVFRDRNGADEVWRIATNVGLTPERTDRYRDGTQHWVNATLRDDDSLDLTSLQLDRKQILRSEPISCGVEADLIGDAQNDSLESPVVEIVD